ncbi:hypothetical protein [Leifsonia poae]|uniref:Uncharacterized protein n=1 Tax=Leifsonia poae TaxID=110933 RepID=A0A9W6LYM4_9MICO|nr:hypothetical protein [Leifsonia poae]GLJ74759.1 hypothetical protein GCM10017584_03320 [Leifsonia poae]
MSFDPERVLADSDRVLKDPHLQAIAVESLAGLPEWTDDIAERIGNLYPTDGSRVAGDDRIKWIDPPSSQIVHLLHSAHDHLHMLAQGMKHEGPRPLAGYSLIRVAIEASALATWLMAPGTIDARVRRSIRLTWDNRLRVAVYTKKYDTPTDAITDDLRRILTDIAGTRPGVKSLGLDSEFPRLTDVIRAADEKIPANRKQNLTGVDAWRACSGIAHSNSNFAAGAMDREDAPDHTRVTVNVITLALMLEQAKLHLGHAVTHAELCMASKPAPRGPTPSPPTTS